MKHHNEQEKEIEAIKRRQKRKDKRNSKWEAWASDDKDMRRSKHHG